MFQRPIMPYYHKYPLPSFLQGICTPSRYIKWLMNKADTLRKRDVKRGKSYTRQYALQDYKEKIHEAIVCNGPNDPYTGEALRWDLMGKWDNKAGLAKSVAGEYGAGPLNPEFYLLPTVDHADPYADTLEFEICSWIINTSKSLQTPDAFIALCRKVSEYRK